MERQKTNKRKTTQDNLQKEQRWRITLLESRIHLATVKEAGCYFSGSPHRWIHTWTPDRTLQDPAVSKRSRGNLGPELVPTSHRTQQGHVCVTPTGLSTAQPCPGSEKSWHSTKKTSSPLSVCQRGSTPISNRVRKERKLNLSSRKIEGISAQYHQENQMNSGGFWVVPPT